MINLKLHRKARSLSQQKVADQLNLHVNTYARVEHGLFCDPGTAKKIADFFGISILEFLPKPESEYQRFRYLKGLTLKQVAKKLRVDIHTVIRWEKGLTEPLPELKERYLVFLLGKERAKERLS